MSRKSRKPRSEPDVSRQALGAHGEQAAARWYREQGYEVVERISQVPTAERNKPVKDVVLKQVTITEQQPK